jgi:DNA polymerase-3 subunit epsilon
MLSDELVVLDFETTGLSPQRGDRITEVAAVRVRVDKIVDRYESLANCGVRISSFITDYTGISQRMVDGAPPVRAVVRELLRFIGKTSVVAHNASFDQRFLYSECQHSRLPTDYEAFICSMRLSRRVYPSFSSHALGSLAERLGISYRGSAHRAGADAEVTANVMIKLGRDLKARHARLSIDAPLLRKLMKMPVAAAVTKLERLSKEHA